MKLAIYGAGGSGSEVLWLAQQINAITHKWDSYLFIDDINPDRIFMETEVVAFDDILNKEEFEFIISIGETNVRKKIYDKLISNDYHIATLIHPTVIVHPSVRVGAGTVIHAFTELRPNVRIGANSFIHGNITIGHDIQVGNHVSICANSAIGGGTVIEDESFLGMSCAIREKLTIGKNVKVGMGAVVTNDIAEGLTVFGNPARVLKINDGKIYK